MAKRSDASRKTLSTVNLSALGADRLAQMLVEVGGGDANWKRRLKMELAAEVGAPHLALEIDKRLATLATGKGRVSWRKRPDLIEDLQIHRRMIVDRLAPMDARLALDRMIAWFDLFPGLEARVKDPKGELGDLANAAVADLASIASATDVGVAAPALFEALQTRAASWTGWIGRASPDLGEDLARALISLLTSGRPLPTGRMALVTRRLAERAGDLDTWIGVIPAEDRHKPDVGARIAERLAHGGRAVEAREALEASRPQPPKPSRWTGLGKSLPAEPSEAWEAAEIAVLEAEGRGAAAQTARWAAFERILSAPHLRAYIDRLSDFDDVEALDRAFAVAAAWHEFPRGLAFLMEWPALREAAAMALARADEIRAPIDQISLWVARMEGRYPAGALALLRAQARALARLGHGHSDEVRAITAEAMALAERAGPHPDLESHAAFVDTLEQLSSTSRRGWR